MLDWDLAALYGVATKVLVQAVRRNLSRFPPDFMFQLTPEELGILRSQFVTSSLKRQWGGRRLRQVLASHAALARKLNALERKYNAQFKVVFHAIRDLMAPPRRKPRPIGFHS